MKKIYRLFVLLGFILTIPGFNAFSQVSINSDNSTPDPSAMLDVKSTNKGLLPPRVALTAINSAAPLTAPATGLHVYNTATAGISPNNVVPGNYYWNGARWIPESPPQGANAGDMLYWNGTQWFGVPAGLNGQILTFHNGVPTWQTQVFFIGQSYQGGIIFYIDATGRNGLIAATSDQSTGAPWGCQGTLIGGTGTAIGTGDSNTVYIVNGCITAGIAARICNDLVLNGYSDWFLPSKDELNQMYIQKDVIGGFANDWYWSSSEYDLYGAWKENIGNGLQYTSYKTSAYYVRAIRAFSSPVTLPIITTTAITNITQTSSTSGGNVTSDGGPPVTARGVCWNTSSNPTTANSHTTDGSGTGTFVSNLTGLTANTPYYVRAYATNSVGTAYGNQVSFTTLSFSIGLNYGGGIIFYIDGTGQHGLIAAISDQSTGAEWGCFGTLIGGTGTAIGTGQANTTAICNGCPTAGIAARICNDLILNGYSDWFLPSRNELHQMYLQESVIGGFASNYYWSSSEYDAYAAWSQYFYIGFQGNYYKDVAYYVRAVRAF